MLRLKQIQPCARLLLLSSFCGTLPYLPQAASKIGD
jgi:hypothetical protein